MNITANRMINEDSTLVLFSHLLSREHVFKVLDARFQSFFGMHKIFEGIKTGAIRIYGAYESGRFLGAVWGSELNGDFEVHIAFHRGVSVLPCVFECEKAIIEDHGGSVKSISGYIPDSNRAAQRLAKLYGSADMGLTWSRVFTHPNGQQEQCRIMKKTMR